MEGLIEELRIESRLASLKKAVMLAEAADALESQAREIERLKDGQESLILVRDDYKKQAHDYRARWASAIASGNAQVGAIEAIRAELPLFDDAGLDQEAHHCEWSVQHDRKRLHALLDGLNQPASGGVDERAAFEAACENLGLTLYDGSDCRYAKEIQCAWMLWQARAAIPAREAVAVVLPSPLKRADAIGECGEYGGAMARGYSAYERQLIRLNPSIAFAAAPSPSREGDV